MQNSTGFYVPPTPREREEAAQLSPPARGTYEFTWFASTPRGFRQLAVFISIVCVGVVALGVVLLCLAVLSPAGTAFPHITISNGQPMTRSGVALFSLIFIGPGAVLGLASWLILIRWPALRVVWNQEGVEITRFSGRRDTLKWEELVGLRPWIALIAFAPGGMMQRVPHGSFVVAGGGRSFCIYPVGSSGYPDLLDALKVRVRTRGPQGAGHASLGAGPVGVQPAPPSQPTATECKWCGETFPAGTTKCPQCGRPVPPNS